MDVSRPPASLEAWLSELGLGMFSARFRAADIDLSVLPLLSDTDLREIGIGSLGHRRKLMAAARDLDRRALDAAPDEPGMRRFITVLFCDIVDATQKAERLGEERFSELLSQFYSITEDICGRYGGHIAQYLGDGALVYFGSPIPLEDAASRAAMAACQLHETVGAIDVDDVEIRNGLASGLVVVDPEPTGNSRAFGTTVNLAARLQAEAAPGTTVVSETTASLVSQAFNIAPLGPRVLKGIDGAREIFQITPGVTNPLELRELQRQDSVGFVGREDEIAALEDAFASARRSRGGTVLVWGEAGIGKSRLVGEFVGRAQSTGATLRSIACTSLATSVPYFPIQRTLSEAARAGDPMAPDAAARLEGAKDVAPGDARGWREETHAELVRFFTGPTKGVDEILWVEDVHWADPSTLEVVRSILSAPGAGRLVILTSRQVADMDRLAPSSEVQRLHLRPLSKGQTAELVRVGLGPKGQDEALVRELAERADGVPIFAEELANALRGATALDRAIPASLQQSLQARIERLGPGRKLLRLAAAMARIAPLRLLRLLWTGPGSIEAAVIELVDAGLVRLQSGVGPMGETALEIRHQLMRECAYDMILSRDRTHIHGVIADLILGPEGQGVPPGIIAEQLERAGRPRAAAEHWAEAGRLAAGQSAYAEAAMLYRRALDQVERVDEASWAEPFEADVLFKLYPALIGAGGYIQIDAAFRARLARVATQRGDPRRAFAAVFVEWLTLYAAGEIDKAHELGLSLSDLASADDSGISRLALDRMLGNTHVFRGELDAAEFHITRFIKTYDPGEHRMPLAEFGASDNLVVMYSSLAVLRALQSDDEACRLAVSEGQVAAGAVGQVQSYCTATGFGAAFPLLLIGDYAEAGRYAAELSRWIDGQHLQHWAAYRDMFQGIVEIAQGAPKAGEAQFRSGLSAITRHGDRFLVATLTTLADEARVGRGLPLGGHESYVTEGEARGERWLMARSSKLRARAEATGRG